MTKVVVLHSGGLDSTVLLYYYRKAGYEVLPLCIRYGQRNAIECERVADVWKHAGVEGRMGHFDSLSLLLHASSQTNGGIDVPHGHYTDESMRATAVPFRNSVLLSIAAGYAISEGAAYVGYAAHASDRVVYPDCRPEFVAKFSQLLAVGHVGGPALQAPFVTYDKARLVQIGTDLGVPFDLTWSCYDPPDSEWSTTAIQACSGVPPHCGLCGACVERREAFVIASGNAVASGGRQIIDPTQYAHLYESHEDASEMADGS